VVLLAGFGIQHQGKAPGLKGGAQLQPYRERSDGAMQRHIEAMDADHTF